jgi:hypothetical protein
MSDRMIFKGHLMALYKQDGARCFLWSQGVPLTNFTDYAKGTTERIANNARKLATDAGRPVISFDHRPHASLNMSSTDVLGFLGRKLHPVAQGPGGDRGALSATSRWASVPTAATWRPWPPPP